MEKRALNPIPLDKPLISVPRSKGLRVLTNEDAARDQGLLPVLPQAPGPRGRAGEEPTPVRDAARAAAVPAGGPGGRGGSGAAGGGRWAAHRAGRPCVPRPGAQEEPPP